MNARRPLACASAVGALLALSACEKPAPIVTVVSGGESAYTEAALWCFEDQEWPECTERAEGTTEISVRGGETVGVDVDKELADSGWFLEFSLPDGQGEGERPFPPQSGHYFSFAAPNLPADTPLLLTVRSLGEGDTPTGEWRFELTTEGT
jgi:hypothetical protein